MKPELPELEDALDNILDGLVWLGSGLDPYGSPTFDEIKKDIDYIDGKQQILALIHKACNQARIDELEGVIKMEYKTGHDYIVQLTDVEERLQHLRTKQGNE